jgi:hypothetical protein
MIKNDCKIIILIWTRQELEKYLKRDKNVAEDEKRLLEEIKKIEVLIKK